MKAIAISGHGGVEVLRPIETPIPQPKPNDVIVRIYAVSINPVETKIRNGTWAGGKVPIGTISGFDFSGRVFSVGHSVPSLAFAVGDDVYALGSTIPTHSNAEYAAVDWRALSHKPIKASWEDAAALPLVGLTAWEMLVEQLDVKKGKGALLVINGAGGVGSVAIQIARKYLGLETVIATASRPETIDHVRSMGATQVISHRSPLRSQIQALNLQEPVKYVAILTDTTREILDQVIDVVAPGGRVGLAVQGAPESYAGIVKGQQKSISFHWGFVFTKMIFDHDLASQGQILKILAHLYDADELRSIVTQRFDLSVEGLKKAHTVMEEGKAFGKVVLGVPPSGAFE